MSDIEKLLARIGTARDAISRKEEQTSLDYMIDGVLMNCSVMLKEQEGTIDELQNAYGYLQKQFFEVQDKLLKEQEEKYNSLAEWTAGHIVFCDKCKHFDDYNVECKLGHNPNVPYNNWFCAEGEK